MKTNIDIFHFMAQTKQQKDKDLRFWNIKSIIALQEIAIVQLCSLIKYIIVLKILEKNVVIVRLFSFWTLRKV